MKQRDYDVVIAGARCAGATLACFLAREGARVLLLDKDAMPSEHVLSTHWIAPRGMDVLDEVGVGEAVRAVTPATRIIRGNMEGKLIDLEFADDLSMYCPRRKRLDDLLQNAAVAAGARLRDRTRVTSLVRENGRVCGLRAFRGDREQTFTAGLVIGADGRHSTVARLVEAEEYLGYDAPRASYWAYWDSPGCWKSDPAYRFDAYFGFVADDMRIVFQTDHDQLLIGCSPPIERAESWRADPRGALRAAMASDPLIAGLIRGAEPVGKVRGTVKERYFFRRAAGSGWALVGDAGHHKEVALGDGMTEALLQARSLAGAIGEGNDQALARWWRARDVAAVPLHFLGRMAGGRDGPTELMSVVFSRMSRRPDLMERMVAVMERRLSPFELLPLSSVLGWTVAAGLRGRWAVFKEIIEAGRQGLALSREMRARTRLLCESGTAWEVRQDHRVGWRSRSWKSAA